MGESKVDQPGSVSTAAQCFCWGPNISRSTLLSSYWYSALAAGLVPRPSHPRLALAAHALLQPLTPCCSHLPHVLATHALAAFPALQPLMLLYGRHPHARLCLRLSGHTPALCPIHLCLRSSVFILQLAQYSQAPPHSLICQFLVLWVALRAILALLPPTCLPFSGPPVFSCDECVSQLKL